jgi:outer membrane lipoprotein-sorting protein
MSELGELLELLYSARRSFRTARGVLRRRSNWRLAREAMRRENARNRGGGSRSVMMFARSSGSGEEPPDVQEERVVFWYEPPDRLREEVEQPPHSRTTVLDGNLWWMYTPEWGATSNVDLSDEEAGDMTVGGGELFRPLLDPSGLLGVLEIEQIDDLGERLIVRARPRADVDNVQRHFQLRSLLGADEIELVVDRERGVVRRLAAIMDGQELSVVEFDELFFDETFPAETFVFVPPPGEEIRAPDLGMQRQYSLEEAAELAGFQVFEVPELPDGQWRLHVHFSPARDRPPMAANVALMYHRANARGALVVSQHTAGEGSAGWTGSYPGGPPLEEVERGGVTYTTIRGDPEQGNGSSVSFDRDGTAIQLQSQELDVETMLELAASLRPVEK